MACHHVFALHDAKEKWRGAPLLESVENCLVAGGQVNPAADDIRMSLFDLIEEHNRVWVPSNGFGKLTGLFVAHIARRRTD